MSDIKTTIFSALAALLLFSCKQAPLKKVEFEINGKVKNLDGTTVILRQYEKIVDETVVKNGMFTLKGTLWDKRTCEISLGSNEPFYREDGYKFGGWAHRVTVFVEENASYLFSANGRHEVLCNHYQLVRDSKIHNEYQNFEKLRVKRFHEVENATCSDIRNLSSNFLSEWASAVYYSLFFHSLHRQ